MFAHVLQRLVLRSAATPLRGAWVLAYRALARMGAALLAHGVDGASVYLRAGAAGGELLPGMSDVDLALIAPDVEPARRRWYRLLARWPSLDRVVDRPLIFGTAEIQAVGSGDALTHGLTDGDAAYYGELPSIDWIRTLEAPGLHGQLAGWRLLRGPDRLPVPRPRDDQDERLAAWLHVLLWWRWAFIFCDQPRTPRAADVCVKLVAEPARAWLWLAHRERSDGRIDALTRLARRLPEEEDAARFALDLRARLHRAPEARFDQALPALVRMTRRIDALIGEQLGEVAFDEVRLAGATGSAHGVLPLADWPAVAAPARFAETFAVDRGSPADPAAMARSVLAAGDGAYRALREADLLALPARPIQRSRLRAVKTPRTDPVSFALLEGTALARFPRVRGWSAGDLGARAIAEHRAWLRTHLTPPRPWSQPRPASHPIGMALSAGRAALFAQSLQAGEPELVIDPAELARRLGPAGEDAVAAHAASVASGEPPPAAVVAAIERVAAGLAPYA